MPSTIELHRVFAAPTARVYKAFIDPGRARCKWLPPNGFTATVHHIGRARRRQHTACRSRTSGHLRLDDQLDVRRLVRGAVRRAPATTGPTDPKNGNEPSASVEGATPKEIPCTG